MFNRMRHIVVNCDAISATRRPNCGSRVILVLMTHSGTVSKSVIMTSRYLTMEIILKLVLKTFYGESRIKWFDTMFTTHLSLLVEMFVMSRYFVYLSLKLFYFETLANILFCSSLF